MAGSKSTPKGMPSSIHSHAHRTRSRERQGLDAIRTWLRGLVPFVSTLAQVNEFRNDRRSALRRREENPQSPVWTNIAFDVRGLQRLALGVDNVRDASFKQGMTEGSGLGDPRDPAHEGHPPVGSGRQS